MKDSKLRLTAVGLLLASGLLHLILTPAHLEEATYFGVLFGAEFVGATVAAGGIYRRHRWGWGLGTIVAAGSILGYLAMGTIGLPVIGTGSLWGPTGILAKVAESLFIGLAAWMFVRKETSGDSQTLADQPS
jgi:hypothetical protein